jgi:hypothetical protein
MDVPVLIIGFNRPDLLQILINRLREINPKTVYLAVDGPRENYPNDKLKVSEVHACFELIDWDCEKKSLFRTENLGCRHGVTASIDWFFSQQPFGIILEDDCIPAPEFFSYCRELLHLYKDDKRVFSISGYNPASNTNFQECPYDYWFYPTAIGWGWASWSDRWKYYNDTPALYNEVVNNGALLLQTDDSWFGHKYLTLVREVLNDKIVAWDYIWSYTHLLQNGLSIIPKYNYINNIGYNHPDATHKFPSTFKISEIHIPAKSTGLSHPPYMFRHRLFEDELKAQYLPPKTGLKRRIINRIKSVYTKVFN